MPISLARTHSPDDGTPWSTPTARAWRRAVGHDLIIDVPDWQAQAVVGDDGAFTAVELTASPTCLLVRDGLRGVKALTDGDRADIRRTINEKVLTGQPIAFRSTSVERGGEGAVTVSRRPDPGWRHASAAFTLAIGADGSVRGRAEVRQSGLGDQALSRADGARCAVRDEG